MPDLSSWEEGYPYFSYTKVEEGGRGAAYLSFTMMHWSAVA